MHSTEIVVPDQTKVIEKEFSKIPSKLSMEDLGHFAATASGFDGNYTKRELGGNYELTCTVFGYEMTEVEALLLVNKLSTFLMNVHYHKALQAKRKEGN